MNNMIKKMSFLLAKAFLLASFGFFSLSLTAQEDGSTEFDLDTIQCWDVVLLEEDDRAYAFVLLYGYNAGKQGNMSAVSGVSIEKAITRTLAFCEADPDVPAIIAMERASKE